MSIRRAALSSVLLLVLSPLVRAQEPAPYVEVMEVGLTSVDVVVTDRDGHPVTGLKPADFEVYESGKLQQITNFSEVGSKGTSAFLLAEGGVPKETPAAPAIRKFIFYIDDSSLSLENRR